MKRFILFTFMCCWSSCETVATQGIEVNLLPSDFHWIALQWPRKNEFQKLDSQERNKHQSLLEGDLQLGEKTVNDWIAKNIQQSTTGHAAATRGRQWPNGQVPFTISKYFSKTDRVAIAAAVQEINNKTSGCINWRSRQVNTDADYVFIGGGQRGCYATAVGHRAGKGQHYINLDRGCRYTGTIIHEMLHVLGFFHEQSRPDRDRYVEIKWNNVIDKLEHNFEKQRKDIIDHYGEPYDYTSIMHYSPYAFSKNNKKTIEAINGELIRRSDRLSEGDVKQLLKMYRCPTAGATTSTSRLARTTTLSKAVTTPAPKTTTASVHPGCVDDATVNCFALSNNNFCFQVRLTEMKHHKCCRTCSLRRMKESSTTLPATTVGPPRTCVDDKFVSCKLFERRGFCSAAIAGKMRHFMDQRCCRTCYLRRIKESSTTLPPATTTTAGPPKTCVDDKFVDCGRYGRLGYCSVAIFGNMRHFMNLRCCRTCYVLRRPRPTTTPTPAGKIPPGCIDDPTINCWTLSRNGICSRVKSVETTHKCCRTCYFL